jgi:hypothetical protein
MTPPIGPQPRPMVASASTTRTTSIAQNPLDPETLSTGVGPSTPLDQPVRRGNGAAYHARISARGEAVGQRLPGGASHLPAARITDPTPSEEDMVFTSAEVERAGRTEVPFPDQQSRLTALMDEATDSTSLSEGLGASLRRVEYGEDVPGATALTQIENDGTAQDALADADAAIQDFNAAMAALGQPSTSSVSTKL